jgi:hypothetical protein
MVSRNGGDAMTGHRIKLPRGFKVKTGEKTTIQKVAYFPNASAAIKAKKSKRARVVRRTAG